MPTLEDIELYEMALNNQARTNLYAFRRLMTPKLKCSWFVKSLSDSLQKFYSDYTQGKRPILILSPPPQHGKSEGVTDAITWMVGQDPSLRVIYASFSERLGVRANLKIRRALQKPRYQAIFPDTCISARNSKTQTTSYLLNNEIMEFVDHEGYFRNTTVKGSVTGEALDIGVIDDPFKGRAEASSKTNRETVWNWFTDDFYSRFSELGGLIIAATRWHVDDLIGRLLESKPNVTVLNYPAIAIRDEEHRKEGEPLFPELKSLELLLERKRVMLPRNWEAVYQGSPVVGSGNLFNVDDFRPVPRATIDSIKFDRYFMTVDTAQKNKESSDYTVLLACGVYDNKLYILDMYRGKPIGANRESILRDMYKKHDNYPNRGMYVEQAGVGIDLFQRLKLDGLLVQEVDRNKDKFFRADNVLSYINIHKVHYAQDMPGVTDMLSEIQQFPDGSHDDICDTIIDAVELAYSKQPFDYSELI